MSTTRGDGNLYRRGRLWWVRLGDVRQSSGSEKKSVALKLLNDLRARRASGLGIGPEVERTTLADLKPLLEQDYLLNGKRSFRAAQFCLAHSLRFFAGWRVSQISTAALQDYVTQRLAETPTPAMGTVARELAIIRRAMNLGLRLGKVARVPPFPTLRTDNVRKGFVELHQLERLLAHLPPHAAALVEFLAFSGWRIGEALGLRWGQVDFHAGVLRIEATKNGDPRTLPFAALPRLAELLRRQRASADEVERTQGRIVAEVFHYPDGSPVREIRHPWSTACTAAGLPGLRPHDLRRSFVRTCERSGVPRSWAMKLTGHRTEAVYRRYAIVAESDLRDGLGRLASYLEDNGGASSQNPPAPRAVEGKDHQILPAPSTKNPAKGTIGAQRRNGESTTSSA